MRRIWEFLSNRTVLTVLGFLALSVLLLLSVTTLKLKLGVALALLLAALLIWLALHLLRQRRARLASQAIGAMIEREAERAVSTSAPGNQHETGALRDRLVEAIKTIKTSRLGATSGKAALYELPWYVIIGNPAAGKSSAIINSGLQFPFAEKNGRIVQGIGGTRNCDWFFTTEGIFLDTAGRYAVQDEDRREWLSFLGLLKQHRAKAPINGIVIAASVSELMQSGPEFVIDLAKQLRQRVQELTEELGVFAPVYVLFTKADLISGFGEFFASADAQERARVWGATLPYDAIGRADAVAAFDQHFDLLYDGLRELSLASMALKRNEQISAGVFAFPLEFAALKAPLQTFLATLFQDNPFQHRPIFRGFYFTSALQEGTATSASNKRVAERFGLSASSTQRQAPTLVSSQNGFFLRELFSRVIFADKDLVRQYANPNRVRLRYASFFAGAVALGLGLALLTWSYLGNQRLIANTQADLDKAVHVQDGRVDLASRLEALGILQDRLQQLQTYRDDHPLTLGFGLYQGDALESKLRTEYYSGVQEILLRPVTAALEGFLRDVNANSDKLQTANRPAATDAGNTAAPQAATQYQDLSPRNVDDAYAALKTYLMLGDREHLDAGHLNDQLTRFWRSWLDSNRGSMPREDMIRSAERTLNFLLAQINRPDFPLIEQKLILVDQTREALRRVVRGTPARERIYADIKARAGTRYPAMTVARLLGEQDKEIIAGSHAIPGAFTREAWDGYVKGAFRDAANKELQSNDWVLKTAVRDDLTLEGSPEQIEQNLVRAYKAEYVKEWQQFIQGIAIREFDGFEDAVKRMNRLGDPANSPIRKLLTTVYDQTAWDNPSLVDQGLEKTQRGLVAWFKRVILGGGRGGVNVNINVDPDAPKSEAQLGLIGKEFAAIGALVVARGDGKDASLLNGYLASLSKTRSRLNQIKNAGDAGPPSKQLMQQTLDGSGSELADALKYVDESIRPALSDSAWQTVRPLLVRPLLQVYQVTVKPTEDELNKIWQAQVFEPFSRTLAGKYPFDPSSRIEAAAPEIGQIFGPEGAISKFMQTAVGSLVVRRGDTLTPRTWGDIGIRLTPQFVDGVPRYVASLGEAGAAANASSNQTVFQIKPIPAPGLTEYTVEIDGQLLRYRNTAADWSNFVWPASNGAPGAKITGVTNDGRSVELTNNPGRSGLERLIGGAQRERQADGSFILSWSNDGAQVSIALRIISSPQATGNDKAAASTAGSSLRGLKLPQTIAGPQG